ncbi:CAP domain-containing protein [Halomonas sp. E14]|uniref:CAP domain-containing protein n=1 Tax=Halomonas sp. E14 TaxID=3397245 RepID=UPI00403E52E0
MNKTEARDRDNLGKVASVCLSLACLALPQLTVAMECELEPSQQDMLDRVNEARSEARQCGEDTHEAAAPLAWSCQLAEAALGHSREMAEEEFFGHAGMDEQGVASRVSDAGYEWMAVGENIAAGQRDVDSVMEGWLDSSGHCANIMNQDFTEMGSAAYEAPESPYSPFWTQVFAQPR